MSAVLISTKSSSNFSTSRTRRARDAASDSNARAMMSSAAMSRNSGQRIVRYCATPKPETCGSNSNRCRRRWPAMMNMRAAILSDGGSSGAGAAPASSSSAGSPASPNSNEPGDAAVGGASASGASPQNQRTQARRRFFRRPRLRRRSRRQWRSPPGAGCRAAAPQS